MHPIVTVPIKGFLDDTKPITWEEPGARYADRRACWFPDYSVMSALTSSQLQSTPNSIESIQAGTVLPACGDSL